MKVPKIKRALTRTLGIGTIAVLAPILASAQAPSTAEAKLISDVPFHISAEDDAAGIDGLITVMVKVDSTGAVKKVKVTSEPMSPCSGDYDKNIKRIASDVEKAVMQYKFSPAIQNSKAVDSEVSLSIPIGATARSPLDSNSRKVPKTVSSGVLNGKALFLAPPAYSADARAVGASGVVSVNILVDEEGRVIKAQAVKGLPVLRSGAREAACRSRFAPALVSGTPVKFTGNVVYTFTP